MTAARARRLAFLLLALTAVYNVAEGVLSIVAGVRAGSLALVAFGADSYIEVAAALAVAWRLTFTDEEAGERAEARALRFIGATFLVLAAAVAFQSALALNAHDGARESLTGLAVLVASVALMPPLAVAKLRVAANGGLSALAAEARETIACAYLSFTALAGVAANAAFGWWWIDPVSALALVPWLLREGVEGLRGATCSDGGRLCSCRSCFFGLRGCAPGDGCVPACC